MIQLSETESPIKILVVDDASLMRRVIQQILDTAPGMQVVGTATNGRDCLEKIPELMPDVITLDIDMPIMNGITTIKNIMVRHQIPTVIISSMIQDGYFAFEALRLGVVDFVPKPSGSSGKDLHTQEDLIRKRVSAASAMKVQCVRRVRRRPTTAAPPAFDGSPPSSVVVVGSTLSGPNTIMHIVSRLKPGFPGSIICLQEIHPVILAPFCTSFGRITSMEVVPVLDNCALRPGVVYMAPVTNGIRLLSSPANSGEVFLSPCEPDDSPIDQLFESAARYFGESTCGILLSGIGTNGAEGLRKIKNRGGLTIVKRQEACIYPCMVKHAIDLGVVDLVLPDSEMIRPLEDWANSRAASGNSPLQRQAS
jgi:two-component system chemotaxis response regulator CheB